MANGELVFPLVINITLAIFFKARFSVSGQHTKSFWCMLGTVYQNGEINPNSSVNKDNKDKFLSWKGSLVCYECEIYIYWF